MEEDGDSNSGMADIVILHPKHHVEKNETQHCSMMMIVIARKTNLDDAVVTMITDLTRRAHAKKTILDRVVMTMMIVPVHVIATDLEYAATTTLPV
jgi:hypothetical protein